MTLTIEKHRESQEHANNPNYIEDGAHVGVWALNRGHRGCASCTAGKALIKALTKFLLATNE